jgi:isopenicillin-N N-acyltransferase-like protein
VAGLLTHANHYVADALLDEERSPARQVANSQVRQARMGELLTEKRGQLDAGAMQEILRDRACYPDTLCRQPGDDPSADIITFASVIAEPSLGQMWIAVGPPDAHPYQRYAFSQSGEAATGASEVARPSMRT